MGSLPAAIVITKPEKLELSPAEKLATAKATFFNMLTTGVFCGTVVGVVAAIIELYRW